LSQQGKVCAGVKKGEQTICYSSIGNLYFSKCYFLFFHIFIIFIFFIKIGNSKGIRLRHRIYQKLQIGIV